MIKNTFSAPVSNALPTKKKRKKKKAVFILSKCIETVSMYYLPYGPQGPTPETVAANLFCSCLPLF